MGTHRHGRSVADTLVPKAWDELATRYCSHPNVIIADLFNEPFDVRHAVLMRGPLGYYAAAACLLLTQRSRRAVAARERSGVGRGAGKAGGGTPKPEDASAAFMKAIEVH